MSCSSESLTLFTSATISASSSVEMARSSRMPTQSAKMKPSDIDLYEINEAFSVVSMLVMKELSIGYDKVNVNGGAVALGHPIGASGTRLLTTLIHALGQKKKQFGLATLCVGGGEGVAMIVERM